MISLQDAYKKYANKQDAKNVFINWDLIDSLPDEMDMIVGELKFDPKRLGDFFTNVGTKDKPSWYPRTEIMYDIATLTGIEGYKNTTVEYVENKVDYNIIFCVKDGPGVKPEERIIKTGVIVKKSATIMEMDGTRRMSPIVSGSFDFWTRACEDFLKEEDYTNSYTKKQDYYKYNTSIKRKRRLLELEKFAVAQADTRAYCKAIRILAGLPTGFSSNDLKDGVLVFSKFLRSRKILKLETAARIQALSQGKAPEEIKQISGDILGDDNVTTNIIPGPDSLPDEDVWIDDTSGVIKCEEYQKELLIKILKSYIYDGPENINYAIIAGTKHALNFIKNQIEIADTLSIEDIQKTIDRIEKIPNITKIEKPIDYTEKHHIGEYTEEDIF